ncbi:hypothetical protein BMETH_3053168287468, partial [methanotrophic bacterial endosymbiont of Bathymodiolus sp.]
LCPKVSEAKTGKPAAANSIDFKEGDFSYFSLGTYAIPAS